MSYQVFARKYRPQSFDEVLGQEAVVQTLKNTLTLARIHQAYLFCGARGVGKTSLARIFAKSINCEKGPTTTPCQTCSACKGITTGNSLDVLEIDGASNTGVDDVRELREQVKFLPTSGKYKIYIIDEVHMLSTSAFNALLKTLEEPPAHVLFIFATTEPHKIPITILSRCQRFDFKRMSVNQLVSHLKKILASEKLKIDDESLALIAHCADGSVRDSLSLLDQIVSFCGNEVSVESVRNILGLSDQTLLYNVMAAVLAQDTAGVLKEAQAIYDKGADLKIFCEGLLEIVHHLLILTSGGEESLEISPSEKDQLSKLSSQTDSSKLMILFGLLAKGLEEVSRSDFPRLLFEVTLLKMLKARDVLSLAEIMKNIGPIGQIGPIKIPAQAPQVVLSAQPTLSSWAPFVKKVLETKPQIGSILEHASPLSVTGDVFTLGFEPNAPYIDLLKDRMALLNEVAWDFFKKQIRFDLTTLSASVNPSTVFEVKKMAEEQKTAEVKQKALSNPLVQKAQEMLGAKVKEVREIK